MFAFFRVLRRDSEYWLEVPASLTDTILSRLKRYVLRADVQLRSGDDARVALGLSGSRAFAALHETWADLPQGIHVSLPRRERTLAEVAVTRGSLETGSQILDAVAGFC